MTAEPSETYTDPAAAVLRRAQALVADYGTAPVKAWKDKNPGALAVGHLPIYTPRALLEAIGVLPVAIYGAGDKDIIRGDSYFQSYICHIPRSTIELGLTGMLDSLDGMIFPAICDVIRNLSGMWQMLFPQKWAAYLDLPQNFRPEVGGRFYQLELKRMARELHARGAKALTDEGLRAAIKDENRRRVALDKLAALRRDASWRVPASEAYLVTRAGGAISAREHAALVEEYVAAADMRTGQPKDNVRVVLVGSFCEQPPFGLIKSLERAGCDIISDDLQLGLDYLEGMIDEAGSPLDALVAAFLHKGKATASRYIGEGTKGAALLAQVKRAKADGVIFAAASFCDPALLDQPMLEAACEGAGVPFTSFKYAENTGQFQVIREQAGAFSDAVRLWESAA
ncbi:MAG: benzoyl-CoA reductase subunit C [Deltaproteobacteria bacterium RBG_16_71_12]|nr:MAG: benzoyl-CoA reductase subunit C [Deltaproteobacteria bacterium RBG_16_71_12]